MLIGDDLGMLRDSTYKLQAEGFFLSSFSDVVAYIPEDGIILTFLYRELKIGMTSLLRLLGDEHVVTIEFSSHPSASETS